MRKGITIFYLRTSNVYVYSSSILFLLQETSSSAHRSSSPIEQWICSIAELGVRGIRKEFVHEVKGFVPLGAQSAWEDDKNFEKNRLAIKF